MAREVRIYEHLSILSSCANCQDIRVKSKDKQVTGARCVRYNRKLDIHAAISGKYPDFCKLPGENGGVDRNRIFPDPIEILCCVNCPACRRDPAFEGEIPIKYKCFEFGGEITFNDYKAAVYDGAFPSFCQLEIRSAKVR